MATRGFELLAAFGEPTFFRTAFNYTREQIIEWMQGCIEGKKGGERTKDAVVRNLLKEVKNTFESLILLDGKNFQNPTPKSHFLRQLDQNWRRGSDAKFTLSWVQFQYQGALEQAIEVKWWNPYDLLGLFLSILGPAPQGATKNNYFLPLTAVYGRWCARVAGHAIRGWEWTTPGDGAGDWPRMFQVTWKPDQDRDRKQHFFLGSSVAGDEWNSKQVGRWKKRVQRTRFDTLYGSLRMKLFENSFEKSPVYEAYKFGWPFGNCAETYPFIFSIRDSNAGGNNRNMQGLALQREFLQNEGLNSYDEYVGGVVWGNLRGPCPNCAQLINQAGAKPYNFRINSDKTLAPIRPTVKSAATMEREMAPEATPETAPETRVTAADAPEGWSVAPGDLQLDYYWGPRGEGTEAAKKVGLNSPQGQMIVDPDEGGGAYIFTVSNKVYCWNMLTNEIYEYTNPTDLNSVLAQMKMPPGKGTLETKLLEDAE
ncbi:hypothetical protein DL770_002226 [Monosporascus sp. CRB-9-2]|nr:hypothetical protein DL770_002226 [Monosporascus sp. CRB-9-2]